jgi:hypothetical protein
MVCDHVGEYHPHAFCVMKRAGLDPWKEVRRMMLQLSHGEFDPGERPPRVVEVLG